MFKLIGSALILISAIFVFSQKILKYYYTYKFLDTTAQILQKILYEKNTGKTYSQIFNTVGIHPDEYISSAQKNGYIVKAEVSYAKSFFENLGRRNSITEEKYILNTLNSIQRNREEYYEKYCSDRKLHILCGGSIGIMIVILLM